MCVVVAVAATTSMALQHTMYVLQYEVCIVVVEGVEDIPGHNKGGKRMSCYWRTTEMAARTNGTIELP